MSKVSFNDYVGNRVSNTLASRLGSLEVANAQLQAENEFLKLRLQELEEKEKKKGEEPEDSEE